MPEVGEKARAFKAKDQNGNTVQMLQDNWLENGVILYADNNSQFAAKKSFVSGKKQENASTNNEFNNDTYVRCYPNPFTFETTIVYLLKAKSEVVLEVYNVFGERIKTLVNSNESEGIHQVKFDAADLPAGVYYYQLTVDGKSKTEKIVLTE